ncbi:MAG: glycosidase [Planctomycetota bacterium]
MRLRKYQDNPILLPNEDNDWEKMAVLNPAAWHENGKVYLLYRAAGEMEDYFIYMGLAESTDGYNFTRVSSDPVFGPTEGEWDGGCVEDPRLVKFGDWFYMTYAARAYPPEGFNAGRYGDSPPRKTRAWTDNISRSGLARSKDLKNWERLWPLTDEKDDNRDVIIFPEKIDGRYYMLHRPTRAGNVGTDGNPPGIEVAVSDDMREWEDVGCIAEPREEWEGRKIGGSTPPIRTNEGWLTLYHGVDTDGVYRVGVMMLDLEDPTTVIARSPDYLMEPEAPFEKEGIVSNVCFPCGNVVIDGELFVYYGGADKVCCVATAPFQEMIDYVMQHQ